MFKLKFMKNTKSIKGIIKNLFFVGLAAAFIVGAGLNGHSLSFDNKVGAADCSVFNGTDQATCESGHSGCTWDSIPCSNFDGNQSSCESNSGCTYDSASCAGMDEATCGTYSTLGCTINSSACSWNGASCDGGGDCGSYGDESSCSSSVYFTGCSGVYYPGSCSGIHYYGTCSGSYDTTAPSLLTAVVNVNHLTLTYDENLNESSVPSSANFVVKSDGSPITVTLVSVTGTTTVLTLQDGVDIGSSVSVSYTASTYPIEDIAGNDANNLSDNIVNNTTAISAACHSIDVGGTSSSHSIAVGSKLYVTGSDSVSVIDTKTGSVLHNVSVGLSPSYMTAVGKILYVNNLSGNSVSVINTINDTVIGTISLGGTLPYDSINVGNYLYVSNVTSDNVSIIDVNPSSASYNTVVKTINVGDEPYYFTLADKRLYVVNRTSNDMSMIDVDPNSPTYNTVSATVSFSGHTGVYKGTLVGTNLYVPVSDFSSFVYVVDVDPSSVTYNTVTGTINTGSNAYYENAVVNKKIYVVHRDSNDVYVIDANPLSGSFNTVVSVINVGLNPLASIGSGSRVYVSNMSSSSVSIIDTNTDTLIGSVPVGQSPYYMYQIDNKVYVNNSTNLLSVIDTATDGLFNTCAPQLTSITSSAANGSYSSGQSINITANFNKTLKSGSKLRLTLNTGETVDLNNLSGSTLYSTYTVGSTYSTPDLSVMSISRSSTYTNVSDTNITRNISSSYFIPTSPELSGDTYRNLGDLKNLLVGGPYCSISVGTEPYQMVAVGNIVYVANQGSNNVSVIDTTDDNTVIATIPVQGQPYGAAYNSTSKEVYVANLASSTVSVIDADPAHVGTTYNTVTHNVTVGVEPYYVASLGTKMYVTNNISGTVSVINTSTHAVTATTTVGVAPRGIKAHGTDLYVANFGSVSYSGVAQGTVSVIDSTNNTVTATINVGSGPRGVAVNGNEVYVANWNDNTVSVISTASNTVTHTIAVGNGPRGVLSLGSNIYVENYKDGTISVIATGSHSVTATIDVGNTPAGMTAVGTDIYVSRFTDGVVSILDTTNNTMKSSCVVPDATPPVISSVVATSTSSTTATITWTTDEAATSTIDFGLTSSYGTASSSSSSTTTHSFTLSSLTASSTYHYKISSWDSSGNLATTTDDTFTTQAVSSTSTATSSNSSSENSSGSGQSSGVGQTAGGGGYVGVTNIIYGNRDNNSQSNQNGKTTNGGILAKLNLPADFIFKKDASAGAKNDEVLILQKFLNALGYRVSAAGAGSPGKETSTFGPATRNALIRFQKINNIKPAVGYFGPKTRAFINNLLNRI